MSFLKQPSLIGKDDEFGQNKYNLNLEEDLVMKFYMMIREIDDKAVNDENDPDAEIPSLTGVFCQSVNYFEKYIEKYFSDD